MRENRLGVAIPKCYFCGENKNEIIMNRILTEGCAKKVEDAHGKVIDKEPCDKCKEFMKQGVILIEVSDNDPDYRLGGFAVIKDEAISRIFPEKEASTLLKMRAGFIATSLWARIDLPRKEK